MNKNEQFQENSLVQKLTLNVLQKFIQVCQKNNLRYFFTGGALIGVLRHQGFVPWDDDVDIGMPRPDYEKFQQIMDRYPVDGYGVDNRKNDVNWHFDMCQFVDLKSEIQIHLAKETRVAHVWIDIFPLDGLPNNRIKRRLRIKKIMVYRYLIQIAHIQTQVDSHRERPWYEKVVLKFFEFVPVGKLLNTKLLLDKLEQTLRQSNYDQATYVGNMLGRYREKEAVPKSYFGNGRQGRFENIQVVVPKQSEALQTHLYGDYMKMPPLDQRVAHRVVILHARQLN